MKLCHTFSLLEDLLLLWSVWLQWIYKRCPEIKQVRNKLSLAKSFGTVDEFHPETRLRLLPLVLWVPGHHDKRSIQNRGISSITVLEEDTESVFRKPEGVLVQEDIQEYMCDKYCLCLSVYSINGQVCVSTCDMCILASIDVFPTHVT